MSDDNLKTWPERIWLQHSEDGMPVPEFNVGTDEITWCQDRQFDCDVEYVRADRIAELERQNKDIAMLVVRLARRLERDSPGTDLVPQAMDFLKRNGLQGSPLRDSSYDAAPHQQSEKEGA